jgi:DNA polymerase-3 subunit epsilon
VNTSWVDVLGVFDLETTGIDIETSRIVSAHVGVIDGTGHSVEQRLWLADPGVEIPAGASAVHGITTERARQLGRPAADVVREILEALRGLIARGIPITVFNAPYDLSLLHREALRHGLDPLGAPFPVIDPLVIDKAVDRYRRGKRTLEFSAAHYGVDLTDAHDAAADAIAAGRVAQAIVRRFESDLPVDAAGLHHAQVGWYAEQSESFQDYMRRTKDPSFVTSTVWPLR